MIMRKKYLENISLIYGGALEVWGSQKHGPIQPKRPYKKTKTIITNNGKFTSDTKIDIGEVVPALESFWQYPRSSQHWHSCCYLGPQGLAHSDQPF